MSKSDLDEVVEAWQPDHELVSILTETNEDGDVTFFDDTVSIEKLKTHWLTVEDGDGIVCLEDCR